MTQAIEQRIYTREEYLKFEVASQERHEYVDGKIRLMTGGTPNNNDISSNLVVALKLLLKGKPYQYSSPTSGFGFQRLAFTPIPM